MAPKHLYSSQMPKYQMQRGGQRQQHKVKKEAKPQDTANHLGHAKKLANMKYVKSQKAKRPSAGPVETPERDIVEAINEIALPIERYLALAHAIARQLAPSTLSTSAPPGSGNSPFLSFVYFLLIALGVVTSTAAEVNSHIPPVRIGSRSTSEPDVETQPDTAPPEAADADLADADFAEPDFDDAPTAGVGPSSVQVFEPGSPQQAAQAPVAATSIHTEDTHDRSKRSVHEGNKLQIPVTWGSPRPSFLAKRMLGAAPTREQVYRLAIQAKGFDPDQRYSFDDNWQTFSQNVNTANHRMDRTLTHIQIALDADTLQLPFLVRRSPHDLYLPKDDLFDAAYKFHIKTSKEQGLLEISNELSKYGVHSSTKINMFAVTVNKKHGDARERFKSIRGDRGFIFEVTFPTGVRYFAITPLDDAMVFPIPKSIPLYKWLEQHKQLFFKPETNFNELNDLYSTRTIQYSMNARVAVGHVVNALVDDALSKIRSLAYGETELQQFMHLARGMVDPIGLYDIWRAWDTGDDTSLALSGGAFIFPYVRKGGAKTLKFVTTHTKWLKSFVKSKFASRINNAAEIADETIDYPIQEALTIRSILALDQGSTSEHDSAQTRSFSRHSAPLSDQAKADLEKINQLITSNNWIRENVIEHRVSPSTSISYIKQTLINADYMSDVLAMLVWDTTNHRPKTHYVVIARRFGRSQDFVIDAPIDEFDRFGQQGIHILPRAEWEKHIHDKAKHHLPHGAVKYKVFATAEEAQRAFGSGRRISPKADLGPDVIVLQAPSKHHHHDGARGNRRRKQRIRVHRTDH
ncbi:hypothetical protein CIW54_08810 [Paraburkholderia sp. T12-10]|nr:hypothetical protein CIW54_08810 [Paraburkholderia sp. T12-10]